MPNTVSMPAHDQSSDVVPSSSSPAYHTAVAALMHLAAELQRRSTAGENIETEALARIVVALLIHTSGLHIDLAEDVDPADPSKNVLGFAALASPEELAGAVAQATKLAAAYVASRRSEA